MKKNNHLDLLIYSLDNKLDEGQSQDLAKALADSADLRVEKKRLLKIRQLIGALTVEASPLFADGVVAALHQTTEKVEARIIDLFPRVAAACVAFFILTFIMVILTEANFATDMLVGVEDLTPEEAYSLLEK